LRSIWRDSSRDVFATALQSNKCDFECSAVRAEVIREESSRTPGVPLLLLPKLVALKPAGDVWLYTKAKEKKKKEILIQISDEKVNISQ
jgi:hypothetical protein